MWWGGVKKLAGFVKDYVDVPENTHFLERNRLTLNASGIDTGMQTKTIDNSKLDFSFNIDIDSQNLIELSTCTNSYS